MNDQTGAALLHGNPIEIASGPVVPPSDRPIDHASRPRNPFQDLDRATAAALARMTGGRSPAALWLAEGHNAGIVSEPGHSHRHFRIATRAATDPCLSADEWIAATPTREGSWWPAWAAWLARHSSSPRISPPAMRNGTAAYAPLADAPGTYVLQP